VTNQEGAADKEARPYHRFFFLHVMKTGGTSLWYHARKIFSDEAVYPDASIDPIGPYEGYMNVPYLLSLSVERRRRIRCFMGHFPYFVTELLDDDLVTMSVLRHPVDRTISFLKHWRTLVPERADLSLVELYDNPVDRENFALNHQARLFSMLPEDEPMTFLDGIEIDEARLAVAKTNIDQVDILGVHERYEQFIEQAEAYGWDFASVRRQLVSAHEDVPASLRRRILDDNAADLELWEHALRRVDRS
jgi:hypothetical protein